MAFNIQAIIGAGHVHQGDPCPTCHDGKIQVVQTKVVSDTRIQYLGCRKCNHRPPLNKVFKPITGSQ